MKKQKKKKKGSKEKNVSGRRESGIA